MMERGGGRVERNGCLGHECARADGPGPCLRAQRWSAEAKWPHGKGAQGQIRRENAEGWRGRRGSQGLAYPAGVGGDWGREPGVQSHPWQLSRVPSGRTAADSRVPPGRGGVWGGDQGRAKRSSLANVGASLRDAGRGSEMAKGQRRTGPNQEGKCRSGSAAALGLRGGPTWGTEIAEPILVALGRPVPGATSRAVWCQRALAAGWIAGAVEANRPPWGAQEARRSSMRSMEPSKTTSVRWLRRRKFSRSIWSRKTMRGS
jgi:hypothetical protein